MLPKARFARLGAVGVSLLAHRGCNSERGCAAPSEDDLRELVRVWRMVDRRWLAGVRKALETEVAMLELKRARLALLREFEAA